MAPPYAVVVGILAVWRLTHLLAAEDGPWDVVVRLRGAAGDGLWGRLLDCFYCLSLWVAAPAALLVAVSWRERLLVWPALSAGAILLERVTARSGAPPIAYLEHAEGVERVEDREHTNHREATNVMLR
jgi:hypothetical protein